MDTCICAAESLCCPPETVTLLIGYAAAAESLQSCLTFCTPIDCSPPGSSESSWDSPGKNPGVGGHALPQGIFSTQGSNLCLMCPAPAGGVFITSTTWEGQQRAPGRSLARIEHNSFSQTVQQRGWVVAADDHGDSSQGCAGEPPLRQKQNNKGLICCDG